MNPKMIVKVVVDIGMTVFLMLLMAFELIGRTAHEWIGAGIFILFIIHHILNWKWTRNLFCGKYSHFRMLQTVCVLLIFITMLGSMISAMLISRQVFAFLPISGGRSFGRALHMLCAYWGLVFLSFHLGIHWNIMMGMAARLCQGTSRVRALLLRILGLAVAVYGAYAFVKRSIPSYLFLRTQFVFFDYEEPLVFFFLDYLAIMGLFVFIGHFLAAGARRIGKKKARI